MRRCPCWRVAELQGLGLHTAEQQNAVEMCFRDAKLLDAAALSAHRHLLPHPRIMGPAGVDEWSFTAVYGHDWLALAHVNSYPTSCPLC